MSPESPTERRILYFTCVAHAFTHVSLIVHPTLLPEMAQAFHLTPRELTWYATIGISLYGLGALPAAWLGDRYGEKKLLVAFFWLTAIGSIVLGAAQGTTGLAAGMVLLGAGSSISHPVGNTLIANGIRNPGRAMGTNGLWGSFGQAAGPAAAALIALWLSWRWAYFGLAAALLPIGLALALDKTVGTFDPPSPSTSAPGPRGARTDIIFLIAFLFLAMAGGGFQYWLTTTILPTHFREHTTADLLPAVLRGGYISGFIYAIGGVGQYLGGRAVHHREGRGLYVLILCVGAPLLYLVGRLEGSPLVVTACVMSLVLYASQPIENVLLSRFSPPRWKGLLFGLKFALAFGVGGLGTGLSGSLMERHGTTAAVFTAAAIFTLAGAVFALLAWAVPLARGSPIDRRATAAVTAPLDP